MLVPAQVFLNQIASRLSTIRGDIPLLTDLGVRMAEPLLRGGDQPEARSRAALRHRGAERHQVVRSLQQREEERLRELGGDDGPHATTYSARCSGKAQGAKLKSRPK